MSQERPVSTQPPSAATAPPASAVDRPRPVRRRVTAGLATAWVAITGLAPHVLHHAGPLAGVALVSGTFGTSLFAVLGFVATVPLLRRLRRRFGSWTVPVLALALFAGIFTFSTVVLGPLVTDAGSDAGQGAEAPVAETDHDAHHG
jgi:hypothetical protein